MPTSSQANIMKGSDEGRNTSISYQFVKSPRRSPDNKEKRKSESPDRKTCELVKFDFHVTSQEPSFEGVFAYDNKTNSCRWQISTLSPRKLTDKFQDLNQNLNQFDSLETLVNDYISDETNTVSPASSIHEQLSEIKPHFTTPCASLLDAGMDNTKVLLNPRAELHGCAQPLRRPHLPVTIDSLDPTIYRQFEGFGFRPMQAYSPRGTKDVGPKSPSKCRCDSSPLLRDSIPKLAINNLDPLLVPATYKIPYKRQGFTSTLFLDKKKR